MTSYRISNYDHGKCTCKGGPIQDSCPDREVHYAGNCIKEPCRQINRSFRIWGRSPEQCLAKLQNHWDTFHAQDIPADLFELLG